MWAKNLNCSSLYVTDYKLSLIRLNHGLINGKWSGFKKAHYYHGVLSFVVWHNAVANALITPMLTIILRHFIHCCMDQLQ